MELGPFNQSRTVEIAKMADVDSDACWKDIPSPTSLNARRQLNRLFESLPQETPLLAELYASLSQNALLPTLSRFMLRPSLTMTITWAFRPLLMDLCARWLDPDEDVWMKLEALGTLIEIHEELFPILSSFLRRFQRGPLRALLDEKMLENVDRTSLHRVLLAYYRILRATPSLPRILNWDLACLLRLCASANVDRGSRWLAIRCYSLQTGMSESVRLKMEQDALGEIYGEDCSIFYGEEVSGIVKEADGWLLPVLEKERILDYRETLLDSCDYFTGSEESDIIISEVDLSPCIANIHGILLLRSPSPRAPLSSLVHTSAAVLTLRRLAVNVSLRRPTLLTSVPSAGKTTFLNHLANVLYSSSSNQIITIHLADTSLDPRSLLGSYVSSTKSTGTFEWKDGVLVKAMREGRWVVLKDIDRASNEVLGLIAPLVESMDDIRPIGSNATLSLGNHGSAEAAESFSLFATRSVEESESSGFPPLAFLGAHKWPEIFVPETSPDDLRLILASKFPNIVGPVSDSLIDIWKTVKLLRMVSSTRPIGIRDLEKFCSRISHLMESTRTTPVYQEQDNGEPLSLVTLFPHPAIREEMYLDARDVFFAAGASSKPALEQRDAIATAVGEKLGLSDETREWVLRRRTPAFEIERDIDGRPVSLRAGRTVLSVNPANRLAEPKSVRSFSMHKQALRLLSQIAACIAAVEPVLLTGETGTGKTSVISHLASLLNKPLVSLNLSNQTESSDLIGGFRPVSARVPALELQHRFTELFQKTFSSKRNERLLDNLRKAIANGKWKSVVKLWSETAKTAVDKLKEKQVNGDVLRPDETTDKVDSPTPRKRRKMQGESSRSSISEWTAFEDDIHLFEVRYVLDKGRFSFHYVEGPLVKAIRTGAWVLLDEINLASPETLECVAGLLQGPSASITLTEQGSLEPVPRHAEFRLFACMNPATDVGKKDLASNIRARFTEIEVPPPDDDNEALMSIIAHYIGHLAISDKAVISDIAELYTNVKELAASGKISDGSNHRPHYSMRSLSRALTFAADAVQSFGLRRAVWEGFTMAFTMVLNQSSAEIVLDIAGRTLLSSVKNKAHFLTIQPQPPQNKRTSCIQVGPFWLSSGPQEREEASDYILTLSVQKKLVDLARIVMTKRYPVLIEGPTSSGKTSAIHYLARRTGHNFVRINNHEHTDIQEYLGSYVSDPKTGKLVFQDGLLVRALRRGDWIVLDELNLAPTDVLEALNRLLDDNRELVIPETQETIRPHPNFMLFATQNPPGVYAGRKVLSRALRNRFLEVHFEDVPSPELEHILSQRSRIAPSYSKRIVAVFEELQKRRQIGRIFEGKEGFATLRDLFRWAGREAQSYQELAENGYMLLAERSRRDEDKTVVKEVIEKVMNVSISEGNLYSMENSGGTVQISGGIVWTRPMKRLFSLLYQALKHNEPVLLVGETGSGKTSVCQVYAEMENKVLRTVNCHQNTEAADIIGGLRPVRQNEPVDWKPVQEAAQILELPAYPKLEDTEQLMGSITSRLGQKGLSAYERSILIRAQNALSPPRGLLTWQDGPLVKSMRSGDVFLLDEISLADDSVLERLNSVLEPTRTLVLAEKGGDDVDEFEVVASSGFSFIATMNPGGDFGKKELSPALRNRFTEIWVPSVMKHDELAEIVAQSWKHIGLQRFTEPMLAFIEWLNSEVNDTSIITLRDILTWVNFCNTLSETTNLPLEVLFTQGCEMAILDGLYSLTQLSSWTTESLRALYQRAHQHLVQLISESSAYPDMPLLDISVEDGKLRIGLFSVPLGKQPSRLKSFSFKAPTSLANASRLVRACQSSRPILLEGSPGVGKTSLVAALAAAAGQKLRRINLSEQTDLVDLFGSDLPVEGHASGSFGWNDADFLRSLKNGDWVLLDEMNLASQSVLEGLNAVFDHRGSVYIPELDRTFPRHANFRVFAAQNPLNQGSGRKGLPKSFLNRFTKVYIEQLSSMDLLLICQHLYPALGESVLDQMIAFNSRVHEEVVMKRLFGMSGAPWEFNLRDLLRWASLMVHSDGSTGEAWKYINTVYCARFRTESDRIAVLKIFADIFQDSDVSLKVRSRLIQSPSRLACGDSELEKGQSSDGHCGPILLPTQVDKVEAVLFSLSSNWLAIVTGSHSTGKTDFVRALASTSGHSLKELSLGSSSDTSDLIGSFEQVGVDFHVEHRLQHLLRIIDTSATCTTLEKVDLYDLAFKLKDEILSARRTHSLASLQRIARSYREKPLFSSLSTDVKEEIDAILGLPNNDDDGRPSFGWMDGPLIQAMKEGQWLLLDNANLCSSSVLDRLNSLCETNGCIVLTEKGVDQETIFPHPDFRLIMTVDPSRGEISRAMRNRGIEIALEPTVSDVDGKLLLILKRQALRYTCSRSRFDIIRRSLCCDILTPLHFDSLIFANCLDDRDVLSSRIMEIKALYNQHVSLHGAAIAFFIFSSSSLPSLEGLLRLLKSLRDSRARSLLERLLTSKEINAVRRMLVDITGYPAGLVDDIHAPLHPFIFYPRLYWSSDDDRKSCMLMHLVLEAYVLASNMDDELCQYVSSYESNTDGSVRIPPLKEHEQAISFIRAIPDIVRKAILERRFNNVSSLPHIGAVLDIIYYSMHLHRAANQVVADFSTLYVMSELIHLSWKSVSNILKELHNRAQALFRRYSLSSGMKIREIWTALYLPSLPSRGLALLDALNRLPLEMQKRAADLVALMSVNQNIANDIEDSVRLMEGSLAEQSPESSVPAENKLAMLAIEMNGLARLSPNPNKSVAELVRLLRQSIVFSQHAQRYVAYQLLEWKTDAQLDGFREMVNAHLGWHRSLRSFTDGLQTRGAAALYTPIFLRSDVVTSTITGSLEVIELKDNLLKERASLLLSERFESRSREQLLLDFLFQNIELVLHACFPNLRSNVLRGSSSDYRTSAIRLAGMLQDPEYEAFGSLSPLLMEISRESSWNGRLRTSGMIWVALSRILLSLYVPDLPLDPLRIESLKQSFRQTQIDWLQSQIQVYSSWERSRSGQVDNVLTALLRERLQHMRPTNGAGQATDNLVRLSDFSLLQAFWSETRGFLSEIISSERIERFIGSVVASHEDVLGQESLLQDAVTNYLQRVKTAYHDLQDIIRPIELAIMQLRFGLSTLRHSSTIESRQSLGPHVPQIIGFPSSRAKDAVLMAKSEELVQPGFASDETLLLQLVAIPSIRDIGKETAWMLREVRRVYEEIIATWDSVLAENAKRIREAESLYRSKQITQNAITDDTEEEEIKQMFPTFSDGEEGRPDTGFDAKKREEVSTGLTPGFSLKLMRIHLILFSDNAERSWNDSHFFWKHQRSRMVSTWVDGPLLILPCNIDDKGYAFRLGILHDARAQLREVDKVGAYSFYRDSNLPEAFKAATVVKELRTRLNELILAWPDQLVLQHLRDRCDNILSMDMNSPVAKLLGALERLLLHTEDWEIYANRENSLVSHRQSLTERIVEWRKLELSGWKSILEWEAQAFCDELGDWWFRIYDASVRGSLSAASDPDDKALDDYLNSMSPLMEDYITSSPLGQYAFRLKLLQSFALMTSGLASIEEPGQQAMRRVSQILFTVHRYYSQFDDKVAAHIADRRAVIEKEIQNLIKLASWRDVNVHALQQSAQKTHRQLYKRIRAFRELLRQSVIDLLQIGDSSPDHASNGNNASTALKGHAAQFTIIVGPPKFTKFSSILSNGLKHISNPATALAIEEFATTIITTETEYASAAPPNSLSSENRKKWNSALFVRKKRSWHDFLKELKRVGLSQNVKPEILQKHRDRRYIMEQPSLEVDPEEVQVAQQLKKINSYFYRCIVLLRELVQADVSHHPDISTRELKRGISSFESAFSFAISARTRISDVTEKYLHIRYFCKRLRDLGRSQGGRVCVSEVKNALQDVAVKMSQATEALVELLDLAAKIADLEEDVSSTSREDLVDVQDWVSRGIGLSRELAKLSKALDLTQFITEDDRKVIQQSAKHLEGVNLLLESISDRDPCLKRFCDSIRDWLDERSINVDALFGALDAYGHRRDSSVDITCILDPLLVIGQDVLDLASSLGGNGDDGSNHVHRQHAMYLQVSRILRMDTVLLRLRQFSEHLHEVSPNAVTEVLSQVLPFLDNYVAFIEAYLSDYSAWSKSLLKLTYVSGMLLRNIAKNGFCRPPDVEEEAEGGDEGAIEAAEGTGLGEGEGKEDVSNKIEDESQFEGIKGQDEDAGDQQKQNDSDDGIDVDFDLGGELEDGPEGDSLSEGDEDRMSDLDDEFDQGISEDLKPIDEEFWGEPPSDGKSQDVHDDEAKGGETEVVAKEQESAEDEGKEKEAQESEVEDGSKEDSMETDEKGSESQEALQPEGSSGEVDGQQEDTTAPSQPDQQEEATDNLEDFEMDDSSAREDEASQADLSEPAEADKESSNENGPGNDTTIDDTGEENGEVTSKADIYAGDDGVDNAEAGTSDALVSREEASKDSVDTKVDLPPSTGREMEQASAGHVGETLDKVKGLSGIQSNPGSTSRGAEASQKSTTPSEAPLPNPHRSLGDALREVKRRFDEILQETNAEPSAPTADTNITEQATLEYVSNDAEDTDMQALGPALGEELAKLNKLSLIEENDEMRAATVPEAPSPDEKVQEQTDRSDRNQSGREGKQASQEATKQEKEELQAMDIDGEQEGRNEPPDLTLNGSESSQTKIVENELNKWWHEGQPEEDARRIWQLYDALTQTLSFSLCEQLRLILEPTRATRLMGDFRTGKRLNMKKIIPYIASNYTKDKIWLRRVRPSQREYQVLIALDDSRSMTESHSIHLAFQTLALVSKALNRLEVGDVAIASFGERMEMVHGFEDGPFTDQAGTKVLETFKFAQTATDVRALLDSSVEVLTKARERRSSSSSSDLWQLEIIISDGICQDHEELRAIMRKAEEEHILVVFIVIDAHDGSAAGGSSENTSDSQNSIVNMTQAMYRTVNGRFELHMQRYLDSFPFEFFVILKNVETLPDVLSDTLRQFFERISAS